MLVVFVVLVGVGGVEGQESFVYSGFVVARRKPGSNDQSHMISRSQAKQTSQTSKAFEI